MASVVVVALIWPGSALAAPPLGSTGSAEITGATTADFLGFIDSTGGESTSYHFAYAIRGSAFCTSGGTAGSPTTTTAQPVFDTGSVGTAVTGLTAGTQYCLQLVLTNSSGTARENVVSFTAGTPSADTYNATSTAATATTVQGQVNPEGQATTYHLDYDVASSTFCQYGTGAAHHTADHLLGVIDNHSHPVSFDLTGLTAATQYCAELMVTNAAGTGRSGPFFFKAGLPSVQFNTLATAVVTGATTADVGGRVNPAGQRSTYHVAYDLASSAFCQHGTGAGTNRTPDQTLPATDGTSHDVTVHLVGLTAGAGYCAEVVITNPTGTASGYPVFFVAGTPNVTFDAISAQATTATVDGRINPAGQRSTYHVDYDLASSAFCQNGSPAANHSPDQPLGFTDSTFHQVSVNLTGLTAGTDYCATLVATNTSGTTKFPFPFMTTGTAPPANTARPTIAGIAQSGHALTEQHGSWTGNPTSYGYQWQDCDIAGGNCTAVGGATGQTYTLTASDVGHTVRVQETATNPGGSSAASSAQTAVVAAATTTATTGAADGISGTGATLHGVVNAHGAQTAYTFEYGTSTSFGRITPVDNAGSSTADYPVSATLSGLARNTTYFYRLVATNATGTTDGAVMAFTTTGPAVAPVVVTGPASRITSTGATLSGTVNPQGQPTSFTFEYGTRTSFGQITAIDRTDRYGGSENVSLPVSGLQANTTYYYRLVATNSGGTSTGVVMSFKTTP